MTQAIQERIAQIQRGEVPAGYQRTKAGIFPAEWAFGCLADVLHHEPRPVPKPDKPYWRVGVRSWAKGTFQAYVDDPSKVDMKELYLVRENDLIVNITFAWEQAIALVKPEDDGMFVSHRFPTYVFDNGNVPRFYQGIVSRHRFRHLLSLISPGGAGRNRVLDRKAFLNLPVPVPPLTEQRNIAAILSAQDKVIELKARLLTEKQRQKQYLMQQLLTGKQRLPGFHGEWKEYPFERVFQCISSRNHQIQSSEYLPEGMIPVVDQGKKKIVAYSNDISKKIAVSESGLIVFGDHTREVKFIDFDFIVGADGTQLLQAYENVASTAYMYYCLSGKTITNDGYSRHFKYVKEFTYKIPPIDEQRAIGDILSAADREIDLLWGDLGQEQRRKKALSQLLLTGIVRTGNL